MKTTIDPAGRLVIPKDIRREAGLKPGMPLDIRLRDGRIEIEPAPVSVKLARKGKLLVAIPQTDVPALTTDTVERARRLSAADVPGNPDHARPDSSRIRAASSWPSAPARAPRRRRR